MKTVQQVLRTPSCVARAIPAGGRRDGEDGGVWDAEEEGKGRGGGVKRGGGRRGKDSDWALMQITRANYISDTSVGLPKRPKDDIPAESPLWHVSRGRAELG